MSDPLYAAVSGLNAEQNFLGVVSQNIANVNTTAYKASSLTFSEALQQTISGGSAPTAALGGTNPMQITSGGAVNVGSINLDMSQGTLQATGNNTDMAIQGNGYFAVKTPTGLAYTRAGNFSMDKNGNLVDPQGNFVLGWAPNAQGTITVNPNQPVPINIPPGKTMSPSATTTVNLVGNLNAADATTTPVTPKTVPVTVYDSLGNSQTLNLTFTPSAPTSGGGVSWAVSYTPPGSTTPTSLGNIAFDSSGNPTTTGGTLSAITYTPTDGSAAMNVTLSPSGLTGYQSTTTAQGTAADGNPSGTLENFTVGQDGTITGTFSNGFTQSLGQVAVASFNNPAGLLNIGSNLWQQSTNSGAPQLGAAGSGARGTISDGNLEGSNVSLANEFVNMVIAQQGYQANAKVITVDQALMNTLNQSIQ